MAAASTRHPSSSRIWKIVPPSTWKVAQDLDSNVEVLLTAAASQRQAVIARDSSIRGNGDKQGGDENDGPSTSHRRQFTGVRCLSLDARHREGREEGAYPISIVPNSGSKVGSRYLRGMSAHCQVPPGKKVEFVLSRWAYGRRHSRAGREAVRPSTIMVAVIQPNREPPLEAPNQVSHLWWNRVESLGDMLEVAATSPR